MSNVVRILASAVMLVILTGCARHDGYGNPVHDNAVHHNAEQGNALHGTNDGRGGTGGSTRSSAPPDAAPVVRDPLPRSVLSGNPCDALSPAQLRATLGRAVVGERDALEGLGPKCDWDRGDRESHLQVLYNTGELGGLDAVYRADRSDAKVWRALPVGGFPAVAASYYDDMCNVSVGVAKNLTVVVTGTLGRSKSGRVDPCTVVPATAEQVVSTLRARAGS